MDFTELDKKYDDLKNIVQEIETRQTDFKNEFLKRGKVTDKQQFEHKLKIMEIGEKYEKIHRDFKDTFNKLFHKAVKSIHLDEDDTEKDETTYN